MLNFALKSDLCGCFLFFPPKLYGAIKNKRKNKQKAEHNFFTTDKLLSAILCRLRLSLDVIVISFFVPVPGCSKCMMPVNGGGLLSLNRYATQYFTVSASTATFDLFVNPVDRIETVTAARARSCVCDLIASLFVELAHRAAPAVIAVICRKETCSNLICSL